MGLETLAEQRQCAFRFFISSKRSLLNEQRFILRIRRFSGQQFHFQMRQKFLMNDFHLHFRIENNTSKNFAFWFYGNLPHSCQTFEKFPFDVISKKWKFHFSFSIFITNLQRLNRINVQPKIVSIISILDREKMLYFQRLIMKTTWKNGNRVQTEWESMRKWIFIKNHGGL